MKIAAFYDIHGNLPALEAVLKEAMAADIDQIIVGGDVVLGPMSNECLDLLLNLPIPVQCILGNCEVSVLAQREGKSEENLPATVQEDIRWTADQLLPLHHKLLSSWPLTIQLHIDGLGEVLFCHATPRDLNENFSNLTPEEKLLPLFQDLNVDLVICGHTHMQFDRMIGKVRVINAGSIGMPFGKPGADWLLLGPDVQLRHSPYDLEEAVNRIEQTNYPHAKEFAQNSILQPPSVEKMANILKG